MLRSLATVTFVASAAARTATWVPLDTNKYPDAVCNDGTAAGYYWIPSTRTNTSAPDVWVVFLESGGWCYDSTSCGKRSPDQTSSKNYPATTDLLGIFDATDARLQTANLAYVKYCTSDAYVGDCAGPLFSSNKFAAGFHGSSVIQAVWDTMLDSGMGTQPDTHVLSAGFSAGGRGTMFNCDAVGKQVRTALAASGNLGNLADYACFMDSAVWLDVDPYDTTKVSAADRSKQAYDLFNATSTVPRNSPACAAAYSGVDAWKCIFGSYALPYVQTDRWFLNMYLYDSYQLNTLNGIGSSPPWNNQAKNDYAEAFRTLMEQTLNREVPVDTDRGVVSGACYSHGNTLDDKFEWQLIDGTTLAEALVSWMFKDDTAPRIAIDPTQGADNNPYCIAPPLQME